METLLDILHERRTVFNESWREHISPAIFRNNEECTEWFVEGCIVVYTPTHYYHFPLSCEIYENGAPKPYDDPNRKEGLVRVEFPLGNPYSADVKKYSRTTDKLVEQYTPSPSNTIWFVKRPENALAWRKTNG